MLLLRKIFQQGNILSAEKATSIDNLIAQKAITCNLCEIAVKAVQVILNSDLGEEIIADAAIAICEAVRLDFFPLNVLQKIIMVGKLGI